MTEKINHRRAAIMGAAFIAAALIANQWLVAWLFSHDGSITSISHRLVVWCFQLGCFATGVWFIRARPNMAWAGPIFKAGKLAVFLLWMGLVVELGLRAVNLAYPLERPEHLDDTFENLWIEGHQWLDGESRLYAYAPNQTAKTYGHEFSSNRWGFRGDDFLPRNELGPDTFRIMCLGDSYTMGQGLPEQDIFVRVLEQLLRETYPDTNIECVNLGVQGFATIQEAKMMRRMWDVVQPDAVLVGFVFNDVNLSYDYYVPYPIPAPYKFRPLLENLLTYRLAGPIYDITYRRATDKPTHMEWIIRSFGPDTHDWQVFDRSAQEIADYTRNHTNTDPIAIFLPDVQTSREQGIYEQVRDAFTNHGYEWVDLGDEKVVEISRFEQHPDAPTHRKYAQALRDKIVALDLIGQWQRNQPTTPTPHLTTNATPTPLGD